MRSNERHHDKARDRDRDRVAKTGVPTTHAIIMSGPTSPSHPE